MVPNFLVSNEKNMIYRLLIYRAMENLHPSLDAGENIVTKTRKMLRFLIHSVLNSKTSWSAGIQPPELEDMAEGQNEAP